MDDIRQFTFPEGTEVAIVKEALNTAIFYAEGIFGKPKVLLWAGYSLAEDGSRCSINVGSDVGEHVGTMFIHVLIKHLGEGGFSVRPFKGLQA